MAARLKRQTYKLRNLKTKWFPKEVASFVEAIFPIEKEAIIAPLQEKRVVAVGKLAISRKFAKRHLACHKFLRSLACHEILTDRVRAMMINSSVR